MQFEPNHKMTCQEIERLLVEDAIEPLTGEKSAQVQQHLATCSACRRLQQTLTQMDTALQIDEINARQPDPAIRARLARHMEQQRQSKISWSLNHRFSFKKLFYYRIPVYQLALSVGMVLMMVLAFQLFNFEKAPDLANNQPVFIETVLADSNMVNNALQLIQQPNGGRNVKEDSAVTKFIRSTM